MTPRVHIDFETRSTVDLKKSGVYVYAADETTDVWCGAYAVDDGPIQLWTPGLPVPVEIERGVGDGWRFVAHNANFERIVWFNILAARYRWPVPRIEQWRCTMTMALAMALPASLENVAVAVGLPGGKDMEGHGLMMRMAKPRRPRKGENPNGTYWFDDEERKQRLYQYCMVDVETERALEKRLLSLRPTEQRLWWLDQRINDRGICVDVDLCNAALKIVAAVEKWLDDEMRQVTGGAVAACSNVGQITAWLRENGIPDVVSIGKEVIERYQTRKDLPAAARRVLEIRLEAAKASVAKIDTLLRGRNRDGRARGLLQFHAASTGRWAGRRFQPHNLKRPELENVDAAIDAVLTGDAEFVRARYGQPLSVVGDTLRGMIVAAPGRKLVAADFSNIEGRVTAWVAGEDWKLQAFRDYDAGMGPDLYVLAYARAFEIRPEEVEKGQRQIGKVMELALGYQGGVGAFQQMAAGYGVTVTDGRADELKIAWRNAHPNIKATWYELEDAAVRAVRGKGVVVKCGRVAFRVAGSFLFLRLPSGRSLAYPYPRVVERKVPWKKSEPEWTRCESLDGAKFLFGDDLVSFDAENGRALVYQNATKPTVVYKGVDSYTRKWGDCYAYGGLWMENIAQAIARDVMAEGMVRLELAGYPVVLTVHDEIVAEPKADFGSAEHFEEILTELPSWAEGLPVAVEAWEGGRYRK